MDESDEKFHIISEFYEGLDENNTLTSDTIIKYIDNLYNSLILYKNSQKILHLKLIDQNTSVINDIDGSIVYLKYINKNTYDSIQTFIKKKFIKTNYLLDYLSNINKNNKYSLFIFIKSNIGYAIPLIVDGNDIKLEITYDDKIIFMTSQFIS